MLKFVIRIFIIAIVVSAFLYVINNYHPFYQNDLKRIKKNDQINIAIRFGPTSYYQIKNKNIGYTYNITKEFAKYLGVDLIIHPIDNTEKALSYLNTRKVDILADYGVYENVNLSYVYNKVNLYIVYNSIYSNKPANKENIKDNSIEIINSPIITKSLLEHDIASTKININYEKNIDAIINALRVGEVKYTILNSDELMIYQKYFPEIKIAFQIKTDSPITWALPKDTGSGIENKISEFFTEMLKTNKISLIHRNHFSDKLNYSFVGSKSFINDLVNIFPLYEFYFKKYSKQYNHDWRLLASIGYQESRWNKDAVSYTGVRGLMMLTKDTSRELGIEDRTNPIQSINGGAKYLNKLLKKIPDNINPKEKIWFAIGAYNIGLGHINDAIILANQDNIIIKNWSEIEPYLLKLSQSKFYKKTKYGYARGWETVKYVQNIRQYYDILVFLDSQDEILEDNSNEIIPNTL